MHVFFSLSLSLSLSPSLPLSLSPPSLSLSLSVHTGIVQRGAPVLAKLHGCSSPSSPACPPPFPLVSTSAGLSAARPRRAIRPPPAQSCCAVRRHGARSAPPPPAAPPPHGHHHHCAPRPRRHWPQNKQTLLFSFFLCFFLASLLCCLLGAGHACMHARGRGRTFALGPVGRHGAAGVGRLRCAAEEKNQNKKKKIH